MSSKLPATYARALWFGTKREAGTETSSGPAVCQWRVPKSRRLGSKYFLLRGTPKLMR